MVRENPFAFALILLDYPMPDGNGATVTRALREISADLYILILSADTSRGALKASWSAGASEFVEMEY